VSDHEHPSGGKRRSREGAEGTRLIMWYSTLARKVDSAVHKFVTAAECSIRP
jgi:hypothetical protein